MDKLNIYEFKDPVAFLEAYYAFIKNLNPDISIRKWSKILGINSPDILSEILKRKKKLTLSLAKEVGPKLGFDSSEQLYFEVMIRIINENIFDEKQILERVLSEIKQLRGTKIIVEDNTIFSHWAHMAILSLSRVKNIKCTKESIKDYLIDSVSHEEIAECVNRLLDLKLLIQNENGELKRFHDHTISKNDVYQKPPHNYFIQVSELAKRGSQEHAEDREFQCFSLSINHKQVPAFKEAIRNFRSKLGTLADSENSDQVYQVNIQFFPLSKKVNPIVLESVDDIFI